MESKSGMQTLSKKDRGKRKFEKSKSPFQRKVTSSYRVMSDHDHRHSSRSSSRSSSSGSSSCASRKRSQTTPSPEPRPTHPPKKPYKATPRAAAVKYSVARSKHMRRIKYALSPISGRKLYPLEPSKTNQPTYASSGQIGSRVTASGIKYTYLLEKVLQAQMNSVQQQTCSSVYSDINNQPLQQPTISQKGATHFVQPTSNATSSCTNVNVLPVAVAEQDGVVTSRCKSATHPSNGAVFQANHNQVLAANHNQIVGANPNQVFAHFHPPMANQFSIQQHPALASQHNGGGTFLHFTSPQNTAFIDQCRIDHEVLSSSSCCGPPARFNASFGRGMPAIQCCVNGFAAAVKCNSMQAVVTSEPSADPRLRKRESPAPVLAKIEEEE